MPKKNIVIITTIILIIILALAGLYYMYVLQQKKRFDFSNVDTNSVIIEPTTYTTTNKATQFLNNLGNIL